MKREIKKKYIQQLTVSFSRFGSLSKALRDCYETLGEASKHVGFETALEKAYERSQNHDLYQDENLLYEEVFSELETLFLDPRIDTIHFFLCECEREGTSQEAMALILWAIDFWEEEKGWWPRKRVEQQFQAWYLYVLLQLYSNTVYQSILQSEKRFDGEFGMVVGELAKGIYRQPKRMEPYLDFVRSLKLESKESCMKYLFSLNSNSARQYSYHAWWIQRALESKKARNGAKWNRILPLVGTGIVCCFLYYSATVMQEELAWTRIQVTWGEISSVFQEKGFGQDMIEECAKIAEMQGMKMELEPREDCWRLRISSPTSIGSGCVEKVGYLE